jgi:hypothetical protein
MTPLFEPHKEARIYLLAAAFALAIGLPPSFALAQTADPAVSTSEAEQTKPAPLTEDELEVLVARIALYPDDLVALVTSASLYPVQIIEAQRYLDKVKTDKTLKPSEQWDGSVISMLNYPEIVAMMGDDLDWTQSLGDAIANQQQDVLNAIQQLRDEAEAKGIIKSDDKIKIVHQDSNVVIQPVSTEKIYVPRYEPAMLYEPDYAPVPIAYYPDPYPYYYYPTAPYFAGFVTGVAWAATVDWIDHGIWGGRWNGNNVHIDCNNCFNNNFNGRVNWNDVDWRHVDRSKIRFDHNQFNNVNRKAFNQQIKADSHNNIGNRANAVRNSGNHRNRISTNDVRAAKNSSNKVKINNNVNIDNSKKINARNNNNQVNNAHDNRVNKGNAHTNINRKQQNNINGKSTNIDRRNTNVNRDVRQSRPGEYMDQRQRSPSALGELRSGRTSQMQSIRGRQSLGGRNFGGGPRHFGRR